MAGITDSDDVQASSSGGSPIKQPSDTLPASETSEDVATNGTMSCSSLPGSKGSSVLRPSLFSSSTGSGRATSGFGSSHFSSASPVSSFGSSKSYFSLRPSAFGSDKDTANKRPVVLRPAQLEPLAGSSVSSTTSNTNSSFILSPAKLTNPFCKAGAESEDSSINSVSSTSLEKSEHLFQESDNASTTNCSVETHKVSFVPLASSGGTHSHSQTPAPPTNASVPSFVFGQNLLERVEIPNEALRSDGESNDAVSNDVSSCHGEASKTNGAPPEMLFSSVIQRELPDKPSDPGSDERKRKSLSEAAREYEESRACKKKYDEVAVKTGEEEEINILQINCKLFAFNKDKSTWVERGRGTLRLNDLSTDNRTQSRVVMRVSGSLRVVLNTKIWAEMAIDKPSEKSVRFSAMDGSGDIKVFLVMAGIKETDQLYKALEWRVNNQKKIASACEKSAELNS